MSDDFDHLKTGYDRLKAKELATAKRDAVEAFYAAVIKRYHSDADEDDQIVTWRDALECEIDKWREEKP